jgi:hypothetical protein
MVSGIHFEGVMGSHAHLPTRDLALLPWLPDPHAPASLGSPFDVVDAVVSTNTVFRSIRCIRVAKHTAKSLVLGRVRAHC